jgi:hypothetical protein
MDRPTPRPITGFRTRETSDVVTSLMDMSTARVVAAAIVLALCAPPDDEPPLRRRPPPKLQSRPMPALIIVVAPRLEDDPCSVRPRGGILSAM